MTAWRAFAGAATVGQGRSREAVARLAPALTDWRAGPARFAVSGLARYLGKVLADGARIVEILDVLDNTYGKAISEGAQKLKSVQPHAPSRRPCFYLAILIERSNSCLALRYFPPPKPSSAPQRACDSSTRRLLAAASANGRRTVMRPLQTVRSISDADDIRTALCEPPIA